MITSRKIANRLYIFSSSIVFLIFLAFLIGGRNPLKLIGISFDANKEITWATLSLLIAFVFVLAVKRLQKLKTHEILWKNFTWVIPLSYFVVMIASEMQSGRYQQQVPELLSLFLLCVALLIVAPYTSPNYLIIFWLTVIVLITSFLAMSLFEGPKGEEGYFDGLSVGRIMFGRYLGIGGIIAWFFAEYTKRILWYILSFSFIFGAALTGSRGVITSLIISAIFSMIIRADRRWLGLFFAFTLTVIAFFSFSPFRISVFENRYAQLSPFYTSGRNQIWKEATSNISITGPSTSFNSGSIVLGSQSGAHNIFLETFLQAGFLGLSLLIATFVVAVPLIFKAIRKNELVGIPTIITVFLLVSAQFSGSIFDNSLIWFFYSLSIFQSVEVLSSTSRMKDQINIQLCLQKGETVRGAKFKSNIPFLLTLILMIITVSLILFGNSWEKSPTSRGVTASRSDIVQIDLET